MNIASQPIDQPTLPPEGDADSLADVETATSAAENISQETPPDSCELGSIEPSFTDAEKKAAVGEFMKLDAEVYTKADELAGEYQALMQRSTMSCYPAVTACKRSFHSAARCTYSAYPLGHHGVISSSRHFRRK
jgi:hypothetical protein